MEYFFTLLFILLSGGFVAGGLVFSRLIAPHSPGPVKNLPYECGEVLIGEPWIQFNVGYYLVGLLFLVFDVEAAFLYPWAAAFQTMSRNGLGWLAFAEVAVFVLVLILGLAYAWKKGALEWV